jgi:hypothetical protein
VNRQQRAALAARQRATGCPNGDRSPEGNALYLRGFVVWPATLADPNAGRPAYAIRSHGCDDCRAWLAAATQARDVQASTSEHPQLRKIEAPDAATAPADEHVGESRLCAPCAADRRWLSAHRVPVASPASVVQLLGHMARTQAHNVLAK